MHKRTAPIIAALLGVTLATLPVAAQQAPAPPTNVQAKDHPLDGGDEIDLTWDLSAEDDADAAAFSPRDSTAASNLDRRCLLCTRVTLVTRNPVGRSPGRPSDR